MFWVLLEKRSEILEQDISNSDKSSSPQSPSVDTDLVFLNGCSRRVSKAPL